MRERERENECGQGDVASGSAGGGSGRCRDEEVRGGEGPERRVLGDQGQDNQGGGEHDAGWRSHLREEGKAGEPGAHERQAQGDRRRYDISIWRFFSF